MNIFAFSSDPYESALWLDDVRKNKMILESAQMLSTAVNRNDLFSELPVYKSAYVNHPCTKWVTLSKSNFRWLVDYMKAIKEQKGGNHKSYSLIPFFEKFLDGPNKFYQTEPTPFPNCARNVSVGVDFSSVSDTHEAYRLYINERWKRDTIKLSWFHGKEPEWRKQ